MGRRQIITFESILAFVTGSPHPPPVGFKPIPSINFDYKKFPRANTCANTLYLPLEKPLPTYEEFCYRLSYGVANTVGFGHV